MKFLFFFSLGLVQVKCAQYWPSHGNREMFFEDTNFKLTLVSENVKSYYTVRHLELENLSVSILESWFCGFLSPALDSKHGFKILKKTQSIYLY